MKILITQTPDLIRIIHLSGKLDGSNCQELIREAQRLFENGARDILIDLSELTYISSAGISALHRISLLFRGQVQAAREEEGWASYHAIASDRSSTTQKHVKLYNPPEIVIRALQTVGFDTLFDIYNDLDQALASFH